MIATPQLPMSTAHSVPERETATQLTVLPEIANPCDRDVVFKLEKTPHGELELDGFAASLFDGDVSGLRQVIVQIYQDGAKRLVPVKARKSELAHAKSALSPLITAMRHLQQTRPATRRGLGEILGVRPDDRDGKLGLGSFQVHCWRAEHLVSEGYEILCLAVLNEIAKPSRPGQRKNPEMVPVSGTVWRLG